MTQGWSVLAIGLSFLGTVILTANCGANAQHQPPSETAAKSADSAQGENRDTSNGAISESETFMSPAELPVDRENHLGPQLLKNIVDDQKAIWTSPKNL